jgi:hypothetical protein
MLPEEMRRPIAKKPKDLEVEALRVERKLLLITITANSGEPYKCDTIPQFDTWFIARRFNNMLYEVL